MRLLPLLALSGCALTTLASTGRSHPRLDGAVQAAGTRSEITIRRDEWGIPHIDAASEDDAWYGLGYVHAQDRLFQLDTRRRLVHGEISELLGPGAVELDAFVRALDLEERGRQALAASWPETRARVAAYTEGLNAGAASLKALPVEHRLLGVDFEPFDEADTTAMLYLLGWGLQDNLEYELAAIDLAHLSADDLGALLQTHPDTPAVDPHWDELRTRDLGELTPGFAAFTGAFGGRAEGNPEASNNWVVSGERTASGKPILANDPHLTQSVPSIWYAAHLRGGDLNVVGATVPGTPGVLIGHNQRVAWGLTNVMADTVDLAALEWDGEQVIIDGVAETPVARTFTLEPRDADPVQRTVLTTSIGPLINTGGDVALAMRWTGLDVTDRTADAVTAFAHAESAFGLLDTLAGEPSVACQNVVVADVDGHIGWSVTGAIPRRHGFTGRVPHLGSDPSQHYDGYLDVVPGERDPERGFIATANHRPDPATQPSVHDIATAYAAPHRYGRIVDRLQKLPKATPEQMSALHVDHRDNAAATYLPDLLRGVEPTEARRTCMDLLFYWDYDTHTDSAATSVWAVLQEELFRASLGDQLDAQQLSMILDLSSGGRSPLDGDFDRFLDDGDVASALDATCARLTERFGDPAEARWGELHQLHLRHPFSSRSSLLEGWDMQRVPYPGTGASVAVADFDWTEDDWVVHGMASLRIVMPLDDLGASTFVHPGGQSGQPRSPFYRSHFDAFVGESTRPLWFDADDVERNTVHTLVLQP